MYTVCHGSWRDFGTAVGVFVCAEMNTIFGATFVGKRSVRCAHTAHAIKLGQYLTKVIANVLVWKCSVRFAHTAHASLMGAYAPKRSANRAWSWEGRGVFATNGTIERFGNLVRQELMNVWRDSILFASLTRHTIVASATIKTVPCHGKSGCLRLRSN